MNSPYAVSAQVVGMLSFIKDTVWKSMWGKQADLLERSTDKEDECKLPAHTVLTARRRVLRGRRPLRPYASQT